MSQEDNQQGRKVNPSKLMVLSLLLTVPAMMTGCGQTSSTSYSGGTTTVGGVTGGGTTYYNECEPDEDDCEYDGTHGVYIYKGSKKKSSSSYKPSTSSKPSTSHSGFGSGGTSSSGG